jgi:hypothetical protein
MTLLYSYRWPALGATHLPPGVGQLMIRVNRITGATTFFWRHAEELVWGRALPPAVVALLPTCATQAQVRHLIDSAQPPVVGAGGRAAGWLTAWGRRRPATNPTRPAVPPSRAGGVAPSSH